MRIVGRTAFINVVSSAALLGEAIRRHEIDLIVVEENEASISVDQLKEAFEKPGAAPKSTAKSLEDVANALKAAEVTHIVPYLGRDREEVLHKKPWLRKGKRKW